MLKKEFDLDTKTSDAVEILLIERYPEKGMVVNTVSEMMVYILEGGVTLLRDTTQSKLEKGSMVVIKVDQEYSWEPSGEVKLLIICTPPWTREQQRTT